ncbi:hypothetical protein LCGC14_2482780 [marine sediment metagenome]|uniref:Uncharacterized protein n=1 Tax=marine sediment metagenome TaxID=412755 RepID=A0A0F9B740_9ZZZZ
MNTIEQRPQDVAYCEHCECSPCVCAERMIWDDDGGQLSRHYEVELEDQINKVLDEQELADEEEAQPA